MADAARIASHAPLSGDERIKARLKGARARKPVILRGLGTRRVTLRSG